MAGARSVTFFPRFTTLVGTTSFATTPLDVSRLSSVQLQVWRGEVANGGGFAAYVEESLDAETWSQVGGAALGYDPGNGQTKFLNYCFQLRWFRVRIALTGSNPMATCWAEGMLR
jgi:hypothetical protein